MGSRLTPDDLLQYRSATGGSPAEWAEAPVGSHPLTGPLFLRGGPPAVRGASSGSASVARSTSSGDVVPARARSRACSCKGASPRHALRPAPAPNRPLRDRSTHVVIHDHELEAAHPARNPVWSHAGQSLAGGQDGAGRQTQARAHVSVRAVRCGAGGTSIAEQSLRDNQRQRTADQITRNPQVHEPDQSRWGRRWCAVSTARGGP